MADVANTWASVEDVLTFTGATVEAAEIVIAQNVIEGAVNRIYRVADAATRDYYWLKRAVAWQSKYVVDNPELFGLAGNVASLSQDGFSVSWDTSSDGAGAGRHLSPVARSFLNNLNAGANTTLRVNSAFQGGRRRRRGVPGWRSA